MIKEIGKGRLFGHPVHLMLVHFPAGLFPFSILMDAAGWLLRVPSFATTGFYTMAAALAGGVGAAIFGAMDYLCISADHPAWKKASVHALLNLVWIFAFTIFLGLRLKYYPDIPLVSTGQLLFEIITLAGLLVSNYLGGDLVLRHGIGTVKQPGIKEYSSHGN